MTFKLFGLILVVLVLPPQGVSASLLAPKALVAFNGSLQASGNVGLKEMSPRSAVDFPQVCEPSWIGMVMPSLAGRKFCF